MSAQPASSLPPSPRAPRKHHVAFGDTWVGPQQAPVDDGEGNWLMSYADMMTLMFGFFMIISILSTPSAQKIEVMKKTTADSLGVKYTSAYEKLSEVLGNVLRDFHLEKEVQIRSDDAGLSIISKGTLFFDSSSVRLKPKAEKLIRTLAPILVKQASSFDVIVEGHTDDNPIESRFFPSNWELSSGRASTVVRELEASGFPHTQLRPVGLADTEPLAPNRDAEGNAIPDNQAQNRRIVIRVQKHLLGARNPLSLECLAK